MLLYHAMIWNKYKVPVIGAVIYIGEERMKMTKEISFDNLFYRYKIIDFKELDPSMFLDSAVPEEIMLAFFRINAYYFHFRLYMTQGLGTMDPQETWFVYLFPFSQGRQS